MNTHEFNWRIEIWAVSLELSMFSFPSLPPASPNPMLDFIIPLLLKIDLILPCV